MSKSFSFADGPSVALALTFEARQFKRAELAFAEQFKCEIVGDSDSILQEQLLHFLDQYGKKKPFLISLPLNEMTGFRQKVLQRLQQVPFGEVLTYGQLALAVDHPRAARAVGTACHFNPFPLFIPCHRVIASGRKLGGFAYDIAMKKQLLDFEDDPSAAG